VLSKRDASKVDMSVLLQKQIIVTQHSLSFLTTVPSCAEVVHTKYVLKLASISELKSSLSKITGYQFMDTDEHAYGCRDQ